MAKRFTQSSGPTQRQLRVGELVRHAIAEVLMRGDLHDPALRGVTITVPEVRMSPDLKIATVYVMPLGGGGADMVVKALAREARHLKNEIRRKLTLKFLPDLRFRLDTTFDEGARVDAILDSPAVRRDVEGGGQ